jgi:ParB-like nuclease domain
MNKHLFEDEGTWIPLNSIRPTVNNPRGEVDRGASFERLVRSIEKEGILVPMVVSKVRPAEGAIKFQLVDGERRFWAAKEIGDENVPVHVLSSTSSPEKLRQLMFHLHMTREQWGPLAQCKSLAMAYPALDRGVPLAEKSNWADKISEDTGMTLQTARDRINVLCWERRLKQQIYRFDEESPKAKVYSYVLAIEASIIEPSVRVFPEYYNGTRPVDAAANEVRGALLKKTISGIQTGLIKGRGQIRSVSSLFLKDLSPQHKRIAKALFNDLVREPSFQFDDAETEITARLPEVLQETPKPQRVLARVRTLTATLESFDPSYIDVAELSDQKKQSLRDDLRDALEKLSTAVDRIREQI